MTTHLLRSGFPAAYAVLLALAVLVAACDSAGTDEAVETINTGYTPGEVVTDLVANGRGGGASFDGVVNTAADLDDLVDTAWGDAALDLHRGHAPVQNVLEAYLGITHTSMHAYINRRMNLAATSEDLGYSVDGLVTSLTNSFVPYIQQGVTNGVIPQADVPVWTARVREQFVNRVNWQG